MKILILTNFDVGLYQFRRELIEELLKENTVMISLPYGELVEPLKEMGCVYIRTPFERRGINPVKDLDLILRYLAILRRTRPDLVITYTIKPNIYGGLVCRLLGAPYAVNITGLGTAFQNPGLLRRLVTVMYRIGLKKARVIFFENAENRQIFLEERIASEERTCLLSGAGVNLDHYTPAAYPAGETTHFLFVGRVMREKGIEELLAAMRQLRSEGVNCVLDVLGGCEEDYEARLHKCEDEGWLHYYGYQKDVRPYIGQAHCFVLPSWHEGMANTNLECAAMCRPVITSRIHGCMEAVEDGVSGYLCERKNADSLYQAMKRFTELSYEERKSMGEAGRRRMEERFDKKAVVRTTVQRLKAASDYR